jgi:hypothetical protein
MYAFGNGSGRFTGASGKVGVNENDEPMTATTPFLLVDPTDIVAN